MAKIFIQDISPVGTELFRDSESYLLELTDEDMGISGGMTPLITITTVPVTYTILKTTTYI